jgi:hypothetical protein
MATKPHFLGENLHKAHEEIEQQFFENPILLTPQKVSDL